MQTNTQIFTVNFLFMEFNVLKLKGLISQHKLTQGDFSEKIGVSRPTVINYFNGRSKIDVETLAIIADLFNVPVSYFFDEEVTPSHELKEAAAIKYTLPK